MDGQPIIALQGPIPLWRPLGPSAEDGDDILQLEYILATLGYADEHDVTVDDDWTSATTDAVEAFQEDHGQDDDGVIDLGEIVFVDGAVRVDGVEAVPGQPPRRPASRSPGPRSPSTSTSASTTPNC